MIWYSKHLPPDTYGTYLSFWIQLNIVYPFICFGIHSLTITYSRDILANILYRIKAGRYFLFVLWMMVLSAGFAWLQSQNGSVTPLVSFLFILTFSVSVISESLLIVFKRYKTVSLTGLLYATAFCLIHWYGLSEKFTIQQLFACLLVINLIRVFIYSCSILLEVRKDTDGYAHEDLDMKSIRSLWMHLGIYDIVQMLSNWVDKFAISLLLTAPLSAVYYNGAQNVPFLPVLLSAAGSAVLLQLADNRIGDEKNSTISLVNHSGRILSSIVFPIFFFLFFFRSELIVTVFSNKYIASIPVFAIYLLVLPVRAYSFTTVLQRQHKGNIINIGAIGELMLAAALMYPLYQWLGLPGVALSFVISTYLQAAFYLLYTGKVLKTNPIKLIPAANWLIKLIIFGSIFMSAHHWSIVRFNGKTGLLFGAAVLLLSIGVSLIIETKRNKAHGNAVA